MVPEGKLGSGWRGFGFHLQKAIAPETLAAQTTITFCVETIGSAEVLTEKSQIFSVGCGGGDRRDGGGGKKVGV